LNIRHLCTKPRQINTLPPDGSFRGFANRNFGLSDTIVDFSRIAVKALFVNSLAKATGRKTKYLKE